MYVCMSIPKYLEKYCKYSIKTNTIVIVEVQARTNCWNFFDRGLH